MLPKLDTAPPSMLLKLCTRSDLDNLHDGYVYVAETYGVRLNTAKKAVHQAMDQLGWKHGSHEQLVYSWKAMRRKARRADHLN